MKDAAATETNDQVKQISLVILRLELDDLNLTSRSNEAKLLSEFQLSNCVNTEPILNLEEEPEAYISNTSNLNIYDIFSYNTNKHPGNNLNQNHSFAQKENLDKEPDQSLSDADNEKLYIGKRKSRLISLETYYFNNYKEPMHQNNTNNDQEHSQQNNQQLVNNAMTMQKALETAYNDWNKNKNNESDESNSKDGNKIISSAEKMNASKIEPLSDNADLAADNESQTKGNQEQQLNQAVKEMTVSTKETKGDLNKNQPNPPLKEAKQPNKHQSSSSSKEIKQSNRNKTTPANNNKKKQPEDEKPHKKPNEKEKLETNEKSELISSAETENSEDLSNQTTSEMPYYFGNPTIDLVKGFLHIYKDCNLKSFDLETIDNGIASSDPAVTAQSQNQTRSQMICMIGVPNNISCNELLDFVMPFNENMQYMRILRDTCPNQYMVLFKFINQKDADLFYSYNNNKPFNSIEDNHCHLAFVERIETINSSKGASKPIPGFTELPACYICLERMDESLNGVISILCNHTFHTNCLIKWGDTCCPVCRYSQTPDYADVDNACTECGSHENLWICLICGYVGCGRYAGGHAHNHFKLTQHTYSMELGYNKVWDYAADNYVHRLVQNKTDGKLVQIDEGNRVINRDEKVDSITLEYTYLLTMQLDSQRLFFEERLNKMEETANLRIKETETKNDETLEENVRLKENSQQIVKEKTLLEKKLSNLTTKFNKIQAELNEEKELNKCLTQNQEIYQSKLISLEEKLVKSNQEKNAEVEDLQSQLKDIMFYLEAQSKFSKSDVTSEEIQGSQIVIQQDEACANISNSAKMANRRKRK